MGGHNPLFYDRFLTRLQNHVFALVIGTVVPALKHAAWVKQLGLVDITDILKKMGRRKLGLTMTNRGRASCIAEELSYRL